MDWDALVPAGAFVIGAAAATIAILRVVRHVAVLFGGDRYRRRRPDPPADDP